MLSFEDIRWTQLKGGYRVPYDPRPALTKLELNADIVAVWDELWQELHHQGDVDEASYAAVPHLVRIHKQRDVPDWNTYAIIGTIEIERHAHNNPVIPDWLVEEYSSAWKDVVALGCRDLSVAQDETTIRSILGVIALSKGLSSIGRLLLDYTHNELSEMLDCFLE